MNAAKQFRDAIRAAGLTPPDVIYDDGKLRRFAGNGKPRDDSDWYVLHGDGVPAGAFGSWRTGQSETWRADMGRTLTPAEEAAHRERIDAAKRQRDAEEAKRHAEAARKADSTLAGRKPGRRRSPLPAAQGRRRRRFAARARRRACNGNPGLRARRPAAKRSPAGCSSRR